MSKEVRLYMGMVKCLAYTTVNFVDYIVSTTSMTNAKKIMEDMAKKNFPGYFSYEVTLGEVDDYIIREYIKARPDLVG